MKRAFDSEVQKRRRPIQNPERFRDFQRQFYECLNPVHVIEYLQFSLSAKPDFDVAFVPYDFSNAGLALKIAELLITMEPSRALPWTLRCFALTAQRRISEALEANRRSLEIDPSDPEKWALRMLLFQTLGRSYEAAEVQRQWKLIENKSKRLFRNSWQALTDKSLGRFRLFQCIRRWLNNLPGISE